MRKHKFGAQGKSKVSKTLSNSLSTTFSDDSVDDFSDNETPPLKRKVAPSRKVFRSDDVKDTVALKSDTVALNSKNLAVQQTKVRQVKQFIENWDGGKKNKKLLVIFGPPGCGKTTLVDTVVEESGCNFIQCASLFDVNSHKETKYVDTEDTFLESDLALSCQYQPLSVEEYSTAPSVVVVDDNVVSKRDRNMEQVFADLELIAEETIYPTIVIITYDWAAASVVKTFERRLNASNMIQFLHIHPVTKMEVQKALSLYCQAHHIITPEKEDLTLIVEQCRGDLRWAIAQLQLYCENQVRGLTSYDDAVEENVQDASLDICRAMGKIFYNKRIGEQGKPKDSVWSIISSLDESTDKVIGYLMQNCYQFYSNIGDISNLMYALCEAHKIARWYSSMLDREMAQQCAQMIAGEATRFYNKQPLQKGFQPIHGDIFSTVPNEMDKMIELWSDKHYLVDDIRTRIYYQDIVPFFTASKLLEKQYTCNKEVDETSDEIDNTWEDN